MEKHKITQLTVENIKKITAFSISLKDGVTVITGKNGAGKSSAIDALWFLLLGPKHPDPKILRDGAAKGFVEAETDDLIFRRTVTASGGGSITIKEKGGKGETYKGPQGFLDRITGNRCFDPLEFERLKPREQATRLRDLTGLDVTAIDAEIRTIFDQRYEVNREGKGLSAEIESMEYDAEATVKMDTTGVEAELKSIKAKADEAMTAEREATRWEVRAEQVEKEMEGVGRLIQKLNEELVEAKDQYGELVKKQLEAATAMGKAGEESRRLAALIPDQTDLLAKLEAINLHNQNVEQTLRRKEKCEIRDQLRRKSQSLTRAIEKLEEDKATVLREANLPIEGLAFTENGVTFNKIPMEQASGAERLRVSVAISAAMNPEMPIMGIKDGSLLDRDSMKLLIDFAAEKGLQVLIERVEQDEFATYVIEDGQVELLPDADRREDGQGSLNIQP